MPIVNTSALPTGNLRGADYGASVSLILDHSEPGTGPRLHRHPYEELWVVNEGNATFYLGNASHRVGPGDIEKLYVRTQDNKMVPLGALVQIRPMVGPALVGLYNLYPTDKFINDGSARLDLVCIHASPTFTTEWLE